MKISPVKTVLVSTLPFHPRFLRDPQLFMLSTITEFDLNDIRNIIRAAIRGSVAKTDAEAEFLISDVETSLDKWFEFRDKVCHLKYCETSTIAGFIIVKEFWNLSHLFVLPECQGKGIGRALVEEAIHICRGRSPKGRIQLNSSSVAAGFYAAMGFTQTGPGIGRPGGCIPFEYVL